MYEKISLIQFRNSGMNHMQHRDADSSIGKNRLNYLSSISVWSFWKLTKFQNVSTHKSFSEDFMTLYIILKMVA